MKNNTSPAGAAGWLAALALTASVAMAAEIIPNSSCLECHSDKELTKEAAGGEEISVFVDEAILKASVHGTNNCVSCHIDIKSTHPDDEARALPVNCSACHEKQSETHGASVHGLAFLAGRGNSARCVDCHGGHQVLPPHSPASPLHYSQQAVTCGQCHEDAARDVQASVHGKAAAKGRREAPTCTDCHSEHQIEPLKGTSSWRISSQVCSKCHSSERINTKFNMPRDRVKSFFESYHGLAARYGSTLAANCGSCHGFHKILPSSDPESTVHPTQLVNTCGQCHPGATEKFAQGQVHLDLAGRNGDLSAQINWWVRQIYLALIFGVVGAMVLHNLLIFRRKAAALRSTRPRTVMRMNRSQRVQHFILLASFILLAVTGFALRFPESWLAWCLGGSEFIRQWIHRITGVVLLGAGAYHLAYLALTKDGRQLLKDFLPRKKDLSDVIQNAGYLTGLSASKPRFGRFGYAEKIEYWAVVWGTIIMGVTGLMIWLKMDVTQVLPRWTIDVATTIHYYEAILACLAIAVWHFYHVIFDPDVYPINWAWWDGKVTAQWQEEEHPLDQPSLHSSACLGARLPEEKPAFEPAHPAGEPEAGGKPS
jgi:formate dehydrogenase gamma subunit